MSETCEFADIEFEIEEQIIIGGNSSKIRKRALRDPAFNLKSMLLEGRRDEQSKYQAQQIESKEQTKDEANKLEQKPSNGSISNGSNVICRNCGRAYPHTGACPTKGKTCNNCGKPNHFAAQRLAMKGLRLNRSKCNFLSITLSFFGQVFSKEGTHPDPRRVADLLNAPQPNNAHEVRSFLGMANYSSKYIRDFATLTAPLRDLTKKDVRFEWTQTHQTAFEKLKTTLAIAPCMSYFDKNKQTFVTVDASPVGISGILSQKPRNGDVDSQQIIAYASRALTDTENKYSQTEKEALAIVWAVEHFHLFLYGSEFTLITDQKPLEIIYGQRTAKTSARI